MSGRGHGSSVRPDRLIALRASPLPSWSRSSLRRLHNVPGTFSLLNDWACRAHSRRCPVGGGSFLKQRLTRIARAASVLALLAQAAPAQMDMSNAGGMAMPPMTLPPMPAIYAGQPDKPGAPIFDGYGDHHHPISSANPKTQAYFDQGVRLLFGFNHAEAIRSFREAARLDADCAMCWWGVAFALGTNINMPMQADAIAPAWSALQRAKALGAKASPEERAWIDALAARYSADPKADRAALDEAFAKAMGELWRAHPEDLDAGTFYAEAMMDTQPWAYWGQDGVTPQG